MAEDILKHLHATLPIAYPSQISKRVAVNRYREGSASVERAAELAGMPLGAFLDLLSRLGVESSVSLVDYLEGLEHARKAW